MPGSQGSERAYRGQLSWLGDGAWTVQVWHPEGENSAGVILLGPLFDETTLDEQLTLIGVRVEQVVVEGGACMISTWSLRRRVSTEGEAILVVLRQHYSRTNTGHPIEWSLILPG